MRCLLITSPLPATFSLAVIAQGQSRVALCDHAAQGGKQAKRSRCTLAQSEPFPHLLLICLLAPPLAHDAVASGRKEHEHVTPQLTT